MLTNREAELSGSTVLKKRRRKIIDTLGGIDKQQKRPGPRPVDEIVAKEEATSNGGGKAATAQAEASLLPSASSRSSSLLDISLSQQFSLLK